MAKNRDILLSGDADVLFTGRDFAIGDSTGQNQYLILATHKGEWKESPLVGAGLEDMACDNDNPFWRRSVSVELQRDGMTVNEVRINGENIYINAEYK